MEITIEEKTESAKDADKLYLRTLMVCAWIASVALTVFYTHQLTLAGVDAKISRARKDLRTCHAILVGEHIQEEQ